MAVWVPVPEKKPFRWNIAGCSGTSRWLNTSTSEVSIRVPHQGGAHIFVLRAGVRCIALLMRRRGKPCWILRQYRNTVRDYQFSTSGNDVIVASQAKIKRVIHELEKKQELVWWGGSCPSRLWPWMQSTVYGPIVTLVREPSKSGTEDVVAKNMSSRVSRLRVDDNLGTTCFCQFVVFEHTTRDRRGTSSDGLGSIPLVSL